MSALESSVTLEDVFAVVEGKRVPLAPELAGYLTLEVADGSQATGGDIDPAAVYISEEGTVALVRPKKEGATGDAETSVRAILAKLLDASGSATPALTASAKRKPGAGLPALVSELEAALIPVNRAAGRRALARLAREVKRVTLGVGRNASLPPPGGRGAAREGGPVSVSPRSRPPEMPQIPLTPEEIMAAPDGPPGPRGSLASFTDEALTAKRHNQITDLAASMNGRDSSKVPEVGASADRARPAVPSMGLTPPPLPGAAAPPTSNAAGSASPPAVTGSPGAVAASGGAAGPGSSPPSGLPAPTGSSGAPGASRTGPPVPVRAGGALPVPPGAPGRGTTGAPPVVGPPARGKSGPAGALADRLGLGAGPGDGPGPGTGAGSGDARPAADKLFGGDEVDSLLSTFEVSNVGEKQVRNDLKAIAGLDPTPGPPDATTLAELTKDVGKDLPKRRRTEGEGDSVEALLALADSSVPLAPPLPPPGFASARSDDGLIPPASVASPGSPLAPPSPLVPLTPVPSPARTPIPEPQKLTASGRHPPAALPDVAAAAMEAALKRPVTPRQPGRPVPPPAATTSGRREKVDAPSVTQSSRRRPGAKTTGESFRQPRAPRTGLAMSVLTLIVLIAGGLAVWMFKPAFFTGKKKPVATASVSAAPAAPAPPRCKVALVVSDVPANAEILLRMGQAPLDVDRMPVGTRLEFVATAEGYAPRRAVIKAESPWDKTPEGKPRIDVPIQLDPTRSKAGAVDAWPLAEPGSQVGGSGSPGTVHVVSNVRGAEVWLLAGLGPEARIEQLRCDGDIDVLLAGPPQLRKRLHVGEKEIQAATPDAQGNRVVSVSAK